MNPWFNTKAPLRYFAATRPDVDRSAQVEHLPHDPGVTVIVNPPFEAGDRTV
ncbi:hypothetical protein [Nocardia sp. NPDC024068]|uniref:hypothetical protein n=1 Tax=Nocardia sp. NPDC024068 TaxID=3157197 RepID=UPI0033E52F7C